MKKLILMASFITLSLANRYPIIMEYSYLNGCIVKPALQTYCICTLQEMENRYSLNEVLKKLQNPNEKKALIKELSEACLNKL